MHQNAGFQGVAVKFKVISQTNWPLFLEIVFRNFLAASQPLKSALSITASRDVSICPTFTDTDVGVRSALASVAARNGHSIRPSRNILMVQHSTVSTTSAKSSAAPVENIGLGAQC